MYRDAQRGPRRTSADYARYNRARSPDRLNANQFNPIDGTINWPVLLKRVNYAAHRQRIETLFAGHVAAGGGTNTVEYAQIQSALRALASVFGKNAAGTEADQRVYTRKFLQGLSYEARFPVGA